MEYALVFGSLILEIIGCFEPDTEIDIHIELRKFSFQKKKYYKAQMERLKRNTLNVLAVFFHLGLQSPCVLSTDREPFGC